jgi:UDP-glucuronate 4-epimerase
MEKILVTGCAGFIGFHLTRRLTEQNVRIVGIDNLNAYYDVSLKEVRLAQIRDRPNFRFLQIDLADNRELAQLFGSERFDLAINLAAQAGVRYSLNNPRAYVESNLAGFSNILEGCRGTGVGHLVFASSSSVYGANIRLPSSVHDEVDHPISFYAATKRANELMAHAYSHLYRLPCTGIRFFTAYGPWGRPDMALFLFTEAILQGKPINLFNQGKMRRDFTYIDDVVEAVMRLVKKIPEPSRDWNSRHPDPGRSSAPYRIYNVGNNKPVDLMTLIQILETKLGKKANINFLPLQPGDVMDTCANIDDLVRETGFRPQVSIEEGVGRFVDWYKEYRGI